MINRFIYLLTPNLKIESVKVKMLIVDQHKLAINVLVFYAPHFR